MMFARLAASLASRVVPGQRLSIFTYHRVVKAHDSLLPGYPDASRFHDELRWLSQMYRFLEPEEACERLYSGNLPHRAAALTLDDGYEENFDVVNPILHELKIPAVYFIATRFLGPRLMFNDRLNEAIRLSHKREIDLSMMNLGRFRIASIDEKRQALARIVPYVKYRSLAEREELVGVVERLCEPGRHSVRMMSELQIRQTAGLGIAIGAHTRNHPILRMLDDRDSVDEIQGSIDDLETMLGQRPTLFAYPNGRYGDDFEDRHCRILEDRVRYAFATGGGVNSRSTDRLRLARISPWGELKWAYQARLVKAMLETPAP